MISDIFKFPILSFAALVSLAIVTGCNQSTSEGQTAGDTIKGLLGKEELPQAKTDSLFVLNYIKQEPAFKKYEDLMFLFYGDRDYKLAWFRDNELVPETQNFLEAVEHASKEGLDPKQYKIIDFDKLIQAYKEKDPQDSSRLALQQQIDVGLTASYFNFASDFYRGRVNPEDAASVSWDVKKNKIKLNKALQTILKERESTYPYYEFEALHAGYMRLRDKLQEFRQLEAKGGWPKIDLGNLKSLQKGDTAAAVLALRKRLNPAQQLDPNNKSLRVYDDKLVQQVKHFQMLNGLEQDGIVGGNTLKTLNVPLADRIRQITINMERWRWIPKRMVPKDLDQKYIWVNIPEYKLYIYEDPNNDPEAEREYKEVMEMRVVVGKVLHETPIFSDKMEYVVMAPYWNLPNSIVVNEVKPHMLSNPGWLARQNMEIVTKEKDPKPVSPSSIDWANVTEKNFKYMVRQKPGPKNALGSIKFLFPNQYAVYLHDTPADALFSQTQRDFSHGCVRLEKPVELAKYILQDMPEWDEGRIRETMNGNEETWVTLPKKVQVYIVYFTAWVDENGDTHFRPDLYGQDKELEKAYFG
ncbi:L,D-transpeptidase family protein [Pontibacter sp. 172403-2]|uniref:L,D-transpeptidase family protein n=1 Tax=Pontibacter rufus TaxID=2791028 RepID=UPI0018AFE45E|nr:L,D-transpeptidase family protein [Pontibacter sp. 172403-2]MBF9255557.1 L,D-transpeptidase family protein [Pontibacter sp. 172403-2]